MIADFFIGRCVGAGTNTHCIWQKYTHYGDLSITGVTHVSAKINTVQPCVVSLDNMKRCQFLKLNFKCYNHTLASPSCLLSEDFVSGSRP